MNECLGCGYGRVGRTENIDGKRAKKKVGAIPNKGEDGGVGGGWRERRQIGEKKRKTQG